MNKFFEKLWITSLCVITYPIFMALRNPSLEQKGFISDVKEVWRNT